MSAFNDGSCASCKRRYGWRGNVVAKPVCPHCGHAPTEEEVESLRHDEEIMNEFREHLLKKMEQEEADKEGGP